MKKKVLFVCGVLLTAMMVVVGCGGAKGVEGTWKLNGVVVNGRDVTGSEVKKLFEQMGVEEMSVTLSADAKAKMVVSAIGMSTTYEGTYTKNEDESQVDISFATPVEGETQVEIKDGKMYMGLNGQTIILKK